jgi:hypothetical protein
MNNSTTVRFLAKLFIVLAMISVCGLGYLNFSQAPQSIETASTPLAVLQDRLAHTQPHAVTVDSCKKSAQYSCTEKAFSQTAKTAQVEANFPCINPAAGVNICPAGQSFTFDSSAAAKKCVGDGCTEKYNFNEYTCVYDQQNENGSSPIQATASTFNLAISDTYKACMAVANASAALANNNGEAQ